LFTSSVRAPARVVLPLVILAVTAPLSAQQEPTPQQREHIVRKGDTLWDLAHFYLGTPFLWTSIFDVTRAVVENPHWIYPAEHLLIPPVVAATVQPTQPLGDPLPQADLPPRPMPDRPVPPPQQPQQAVMTTVDLRRPIVPLAEYLAVPWVSATAEREVVGRIVQNRDPAGSRDVLANTLHPTDLVYVSMESGSANIGDSLVVVRFGRGLAGRGRVVEPFAVLRVDSVAVGVVIARIARQLGETRVGDPVLLLGAVPEIGLGSPEPVENGIEGELLQFVAEEPLHGTTDLAFLSVGAREGVGIGDEFAVYVPARADEPSATALPATDVATVRVVKVGETTATVRVVSVRSTALRAGLPVRMIRKMP
jgi:hypothetical protein